MTFPLRPSTSKGSVWVFGHLVRMRFMLEQPIPEFLIDSEDVLRAELGTENELVVEIAVRAPTLFESTGTKQPICTAYGTWDLSSEHAAVFDALARGDESTLPRKRHKDYWVLPDFSDEFAEAVSVIKGQLREVSERVVSLVRWRHAVLGPTEPLAGFRMGFSLGGESWGSAPSGYRIWAVPTEIIQRYEFAPTDVASYAKSGSVEPLHWELYREAENLREANPRSTLLMLVAAAETGVKTTIAHLVPEAQWLVERGPSPPLVDLTWKYLPTLAADAAVGGNVEVLPKKPFRRVLQRAVEARNTLAHVGDQPPSPDFVFAVTITVSNLLWMLDHARGHSWARRHVHHDFGVRMIEDALAE